jgi:trans-aconitate 2-methyltransferase
MTIWEPETYNRFAAEREQPFWDLAGLLGAVDRPDVVDLGCGDGRLTAALHTRLAAASTLGIDSSDAMLANSSEHAGSGVSFQRGDLADWPVTREAVDIVFANASLQWAPDHPGVLARWVTGLRSGGQLAVQVPANADHPSHVVAREVGRELLGDDAPPDTVMANVLAPERYAELLDELGFEEQHVRLQVYVHHLASTNDVVEWVQGTSLTRFRAVLDDESYAHFIDVYRARLLAVLGERSPYLYPFKRILLWGRRA